MLYAFYDVDSAEKQAYIERIGSECVAKKTFHSSLKSWLMTKELRMQPLLNMQK